MDRAKAIELLSATSPDDRLTGAKFLIREAKRADASTLRVALRKETVSWVRRALRAAILRAEADRTGAALKARIGGDISEEVRRQVYAEAVHEVTTTILHEFGAQLGLLRTAAAGDIANPKVSSFEGSETHHRLDRVAALMDTVRDLRTATGAPRLGEFDLELLLQECIQTERREGIEILMEGPAHLLVRGDPELLRIAIVNGLRNAFEAAGSAGSQAKRVTVTWGATRVDYWLAILDNGPGLAIAAAEATTDGVSTKPNHFGYGLPIATRAIQSMGGDLVLKNHAAGGAHFELRWFKDEDPVRRGQ